MKILYAVQATGNGHIARAKELIPYLQRYGTVDVFLSGSNSNLNIEFPVKYRSKGLSLFYGNRGGLDYWKMVRAFSPLRILQEAKQLPVHSYDVVLSDFESITALSCKMKRKAFVHFGHQASFASASTPRPDKKDAVGELILSHYASSNHNIGLHFDKYDADIWSPVIKAEILNAMPVNDGHITVYLSHYSDSVVMEHLQRIPDIHFHLFSKKEKESRRIGNVKLIPVDNARFTDSLIRSAGVITGAGFETPAEALYLGKKLLCLPITCQYEQLCNAAALQRFGVRILEKVNERFAFEIKTWLNSLPAKQLVLHNSTEDVVDAAIETALAAAKRPETFDVGEFQIPFNPYTA